VRQLQLPPPRTCLALIAALCLAGCKDEKAPPERTVKPVLDANAAGAGDPWAGSGGTTAPPPTPAITEAEITRRVDAAFAVYETLAHAAEAPAADCATTAAAITRALDEGAEALAARRAIDADPEDAERADAAFAARRERFAALARTIDAAARRCPGDQTMERLLDRLD
jgi:hypothetical protein